MVIVNLTTGIMFLLFTSMHFVCEEFYDGDQGVDQPHMKWSVAAESLKNSDLEGRSRRASHLTTL
jgi:hypothetical protein